MSTGKHQFRAAGRDQFFGQLDLVQFDEALADLAPFGERKRVRHRAADQDFVADRKQVADHVDLVRDFRAAQDGDERPLRLGQRVGEILHLLGDEKAHHLGLLAHRLRHGDHRRVFAMARAEGVVAINVGQSREGLGELGVAFLLARVEPQILEHEQPARRQSAALARASSPTVSAAKATDRPNSSARRSAAGLRLYFGSAPTPFGPAEVADQNQFAFAIEHRFDGGQRHADPQIVGDFLVVIERHIEIDPHQDGLVRHIDVGNVSLGHVSI